MRVRLGCIVLAGLTVCYASGPKLNLPEPPHQRTPWPPPAAGPTNLLPAVTTLFEQGFPDPRGCEYREIEVEVSGVWGAKSIMARTRGWVLPGTRGSRQPFAICWNGLIYPVAKVGAVADVRLEATNAIPSIYRRFNSAVGEIASVFSTNALSTRVLLLLRCGDVEAALKNWKPDERLASGWHTRRSPPAAESASAQSYDPYLEFAGDWAWALFDRTICAHMRGDEALALATARKLAEVQPKIEAEAAKRGFPRQKYFDSARRDKGKPYLDFLEQLPQLLADLGRREREGARASVLQTGLTNIAQPSARIAALVRDLDLVAARQWGQPGGVSLGGDPIVGALIQEGDAAVEPLLDCLETDKRLTRSVSFGRDFFRSRTVIPVNSAANVAVRAILQANFGSVAEMRAYWNKYKSLKLEERWYAILKDDSAGMGRWQEAAGNITQPENIRRFPGTGFSVESPAPTNAPVRWRGEVLRAKAGPSVSELLARRAIEIPATNIAGYDLGAACDLGLRLAAWDGRAALAVAKTLTERCRAVLEYSDQGNPESRQGTGILLAKIAVARADNGDPEGFADYAAWLKSTTPEQLQHSLAENLDPLMRFSTNQILQQATDSLFSDTNPAWGKLPWKAPGLFHPKESQLVRLPAFRRLLARELDRKEACGVIEWREPNTATFQIANYMSGSRGLALPESDRPASGTKSELRWCDWIAWSLSNANQIPLFNPFSPVEARDQAIETAKARLGGR